MQDRKKIKSRKSGRMPSDIRRALEIWGLFALFNIAAGICTQLGEIGAMIGTILFGLEFFFWPFILVWMFIASRIRLVRQRSFVMVLEYLDQTIRLNLPLPVMLKAAGMGERGWLGSTLRNIGRDIEAGRSVEDSINEHYEHIPLRASTALGIAERTGTFGKTLPWLIKTEKQRFVSQSIRRGISNGYLIVLLGATLLMMLFVSVVIMPRFDRIFEDFNATQPGVTMYVVWVSDWIWGKAYPYQVIPGLIWLILAFVFCMLLRLPTVQRLVKRGLYHLPVIGSVFENRQLADVNFMIAQAIDAGLPLHAAIEESRHLDVTPGLRNKLWSWMTKLESGVPVSKAAAESNLPAVMVNLLAGDSHTTGYRDTFEFLSSYYASKFSRVWLMFQSVTGPLMVVLLGGVVGLMAYALFEPLIALIWQTTKTSGTY